MKDEGKSLKILHHQIIPEKDMIELSPEMEGGLKHNMMIWWLQYNFFYYPTPFLPSGLSGWRGQRRDRSVTHGVAEPGAGEMLTSDWSSRVQYSPLIGCHRWPPLVTLARVQSALWTHTEARGRYPDIPPHRQAAQKELQFLVRSSTPPKSDT